MLLYLASLLFGSGPAQPEVDAVALQELLAASGPLRSASSYRVMVGVERETPLAGDDSTARHLEALHECDQPLRLKTQEVEAFRGHGRIAYRARGTAEPWKVVAIEEAAHQGPPFPVLAAMARLALPHELLADLESRLRSLQRIENSEDGASVDYEGVLADPPALLVVTVSHAGLLEEITLRPESGFSLVDLEGATWTYVVDELDRIVVSVPGEVQELLQGSPQGRTLGGAPAVGTWTSKGETKMKLATLAGAMVLGIMGSPQEPPSRTEAPDPQADSLSKLKTAAVELAEASSYRFELEARIDAEALVRKRSEHPPGRPENQGQEEGDGQFESAPPVAPVKQDSGEITIEMEGEYARSMPIHLEGEEMEAFRLAQKVAFRVGEGQWRLQTDPPALKDDAGGVRPQQEADQALWAACVIPPPHDLLRDLSTKASSASVTEGVEKGGLLARDKVVYEAELDSECIRECLESFVNPNGMTCSVRVTTRSGGEIEKIELTASRKYASPRAPASAAATAAAIVTSIDHEPDLSLCYTLKDVNERVEVDVPEEARELLTSGQPAR